MGFLSFVGSMFGYYMVFTLVGLSVSSLFLFL